MAAASSRGLGSGTAARGVSPINIKAPVQQSGDLARGGSLKGRIGSHPAKAILCQIKVGDRQTLNTAKDVRTVNTSTMSPGANLKRPASTSKGTAAPPATVTCLTRWMLRESPRESKATRKGLTKDADESA